jgi:hypothetical protein
MILASRADGASLLGEGSSHRARLLARLGHGVLSTESSIGCAAVVPQSLEGTLAMAPQYLVAVPARARARFKKKKKSGRFEYVPPSKALKPP